MIRTFRPWTHTSDDSYIYQLSLVVATATVSYLLYSTLLHDVFVIAAVVSTELRRTSDWTI